MARRSTGQILDLLLRLEPLLAEGLSLSKASKTLGTSASTVKRWRQSGWNKQAAFPPPRPV